MPFHAIATLSGNRQKTIPNKSEDQLLSEVVLPFVSNGVITAQWGKSTQSYQVLELRIYETTTKWDKRTGPLSDLTKGKKNQFPRFEAKARWEECPARIRNHAYPRRGARVTRRSKGVPRIR